MMPKESCLLKFVCHTAIGLLGVSLVNCRPRSRELASSPFSADVSLTPALMERCPNDKAKHWGQLSADTDLMAFKLRNMGNNEVAHVAVLDTGLDMTQASSFNVIGGIQALPGIVPGDRHPTLAAAEPYKAFGTGASYVGDPALDTGGHGTMVASVIAGGEGVGVAQNVRLKVYRITKQFSDGVSPNDAETAIYNSCLQNLDPSGVTILNYSWGGRLDEAGFKLDENRIETKKLHDLLAAKGCLVVKAAGNDNFRARQTFDLDGPYLRVAAIDSTRELASFSTSGVLSAPGADIYLFNSAQQSRQPAREKMCGNVKLRSFANGTSFAAPFAAGLMSQYVRVLKTSPAFRDLPPPSRITLLNRIAKASEWQGTMNGLRGVRIAELWNAAADRNEALRPDGTVYLTKLLDRTPDEVCRKPTPTCSVISELEQLRGCMNLARAQLALCGEPQLKVASDLINTAFKSNAYELGFMWARLIEKLNPEPELLASVRKTAISSYLKRNGYFNGDTYHKLQALRQMPIGMIRTMMAPFLADYVATGRNPAQFLKQMVQGMLRSYDVKSSLELGFDPTTGEDRGSKSTLDAVMSIMKTTENAVGPAGPVFLLREEMRRHEEDLQSSEEWKDKFSSWPVEESTYLARILDGLATTMQGESGRRDLMELEQDLLRLMRKYNQYYGPQTEVLPILTERYPSRPTIFPLLRRQRGMIVQDAQSNSPQTLSPVEVQFLLAEPPSGFDVQEFAVRVFELIAGSQGWGVDNDDELTDTILLMSARDARGYESRGFRLRLMQALVKATNAHMLTSLIWNYQSDTVLGDINFGNWILVDNYWEKKKTALTYQKHPALRPQIMQHLAAKLFAGLQAFPSDRALVYPRRYFEYKTSVLPRFFFSPSDSSLNRVRPVVFNERYDHRGSGQDRAEQAFVDVRTVSLPAVVASLCRAALRPETKDFADAMLSKILEKVASYYSGTWFGLPEDNPTAALQSLKSSKDWREAADAVLRAPAGSGLYGSQAVLKRVYENLERLR